MAEVRRAEEWQRWTGREMAESELCIVFDYGIARSYHIWSTNHVSTFPSDAFLSWSTEY